MSKPKPLHFKTNVLLKNFVGKDLINDDSIAVVELVKNAYDAKSSSVLVKFERLNSADTTTQESRLVVSDKGVGMDATDIEDKWLNIAYSDKAVLIRDHGAYFAGNKGVGRFSCDRLGAKLDLLTRKGTGNIYHLEIPWPSFEVEGDKDLTIQQIEMELKTVSTSRAKEISGLDMPAHGTVLAITDLRSVWDREKFLELRRSLEKFLSPNQLFLKKTFDIRLEVPDLAKNDRARPAEESVNGLIKNQVFVHLQFKSTYIESTIDSDGEAVETVVWHDGEQVFRLKERNALPLKNVRAVVYFLNPYKKAYFKRQTGFRSIDFGSIFLFLNGFRIAPYGDRGDDWLGLDVRKTQGTSRYLGSRDLVGRVEVLDDEASFKPISSREGLKKTAAFVHLRDDFILEAIRRLEHFVVDGLNWDSVPTHLRDSIKTEEGLSWKNPSEEYSESWDRKRQRIALAIMTYIGSTPERIIKFWFNPSLLEGVFEQRAEEAQELLGEIEGFDSSQVDASLKQSLAKLRKILAEKDDAVRVARKDAATLRVAVAEQKHRIGTLTRQTETYKAQTLFLQSVSSLDAKSLVAFHHEIFLNSSIISNYIAKTVKVLRESDGADKALHNLERISLANRRISAIAQFATKANFKSVTGKEITDVPAFVEQYLRNVATDFIASGLTLQITNSVSEAFELKVRRIELSIVVDNIVSNASKAQAGTLRVSISKVADNKIRISFIDDGKGLSDSIKDPKDVFELGVTTTSGSGLGLYHSREIVHSLGGTIRALPASPKGLEIRLELTR